MSLVLIRIDDRVIHGQVVEGWARVLKIKHILVVNDLISQDEMRKMLYCMAVPSSIKVSFKNIPEAARMIKDHCLEDIPTMLLFAQPSDVKQFLEQGVDIKSVNVGGMHHSEGKRQILKFVSIGPEDADAFRHLLIKGIEVEARAVPTDDKILISQFL